MAITPLLPSNRPYWLQFVFAGQAFTLFERFDLTMIGKPHIISFTTGNNIPHLISATFNFVGGGPVMVELIEDPTITHGSAMTPSNLNRLSSKTPLTSFYTGSTGLSGGTVVENYFVPGGGADSSIGQRSNFIFELLLKSNTTYALTFDNKDVIDSDFHFNLLFYETFN